MGSDIRRSLAIGAVLAAACAVPAQAEIYSNERFSESGSDDFEECGLQLHSEFEATGRDLTRTGKHASDTAFFGHFQIDAVETVTNTANGKFYTFELRNLIHDTKAVPQEEEHVFVFDTIEVGQPVTVRDMTGEIRVRDRGQVRYTYSFDTLGNDGEDGNPAPGGEILEDLDLKLAGPHPQFVMSEEEWCGLVVNMIG